MSVVPRLALKPHWLSGRCSSAIVGTSLFSNTLAKILLAMERTVIPRLFEQSDFSPLFLYRVIMTAVKNDIECWTSIFPHL